MTSSTMKTILTKRLLRFLIEKGYKYCLSSTTSTDQQDAKIDITLKPVKKHPSLQKLPEPYQSYCDLLTEPFQMASGLPDTRIFVELNLLDFRQYGLDKHNRQLF